MKPRLAIKAHINIGLLYLKRTLASAYLKRTGSVARKSRYSHIACSVFMLGFLGAANCTEIVIKVVGNAIYVAADSLASEGQSNFGTCKILRVKEGANAIYFSWSGRRGSIFYDIRKDATATGSNSSTLYQADFGFSDAHIQLMTAYAHSVVPRPIGYSSFTVTGFYGIENGKPKVFRRTFDLTPTNRPSINDDRTIVPSGTMCPPDCGDFINLGDTGQLHQWVSQHPSITSKPPAQLVECLIKVSMEHRPAVGGAISVAKIDASGLTWIDDKKGACKNGPEEQRWPLEPNPPACDLLSDGTNK